MDIVWDKGSATVRDVYQVLLAKRQIAYTTVMTVMGNLARKGALQRRRNGRAYVYCPLLSKEEWGRSRVARLVDALVGRLSEPVMTYLVEGIAGIAPQRLDELERAIARLREERRKTADG